MIVMLCDASYGLAELVKTKELPKELGEIVHLGHDVVLLLAAVVFGTNWNESGRKRGFLTIREWHEHLRSHTGFLIRSMGGREINCVWDVEGFSARKPNTRGGNRSDAFDDNEFHWNSGDCDQGSIGATSARGEWSARLPTKASAAD